MILKKLKIFTAIKMKTPYLLSLENFCCGDSFKRIFQTLFVKKLTKRICAVSKSTA